MPSDDFFDAASNTIRMIRRITVLSFVMALIQFGVNAQLVDYKEFYFAGKNLFREGKYNLAMENFKKAIPYDKNNPFSEYASFYYAVAAYNQGYTAVSRDQFNQLKSLYPKWDKMDDVNFWLGKIHLEIKDYFQGLKLLNAIQDKKFQPEITALKQKTLRDIQDAETLRMMNEEYPKDEVIARQLAKVLAKNPADASDRAQLESIIGKFNFNRTDFIVDAPETFYKEIYSVSALFPFLVNTLEPSPFKKKNQLVLDLYEGMKLAVDTLSKQGINISLRAYDTERSADKMKKILETDELRNTDLIVGAMYAEENKPAQDFSLTNRINIFNPLSNNSENLGANPYAFLFQPSFETLGKKSAEYVMAHARKKNCIVFYGTSKRDSVLASNFVQKANQNGLTVLSSQRIAREAREKINTQLATATEYDEFKYPSQFTLKKDSVGSIFVASDDALIYSKVLSSVEMRNDSILVVGSENWLEQANYEKYQQMGIVLASPNYMAVNSPANLAFVKKFVHTRGRNPSMYAKLGYEFMLFAGQQLKKNGVYFQDALNREAFIKGALVEGFNFQQSHDNQVVPFVRFEKGTLVVIRK